MRTLQIWIEKTCGSKMCIVLLQKYWFKYPKSIFLIVSRTNVEIYYTDAKIIDPFSPSNFVGTTVSKGASSTTFFFLWSVWHSIGCCSCSCLLVFELSHVAAASIKVFMCKMGKPRRVWQSTVGRGRMRGSNYDCLD